MKLGITVVLAAAVGSAACSHHQPPPQTAGATPANASAQTALVESAEPTRPPLVPGAPSVPKDAAVAPPVGPAIKPAERLPVSASSSIVAAPIPGSLPTVSLDPSVDKPETSADQESVHEIRALLAVDKTLSPAARRITIVARGGRVHLTGQVNTAEERAAIERSARKAANVIDVKNQLVVLE